MFSFILNKISDACLLSQLTHSSRTSMHRNRKKKHKKCGKRKEHLKEELPYIIKQSETMGRYLVASRDLTAGSVIMEEEAVIVGPIQDSKPLCLGCYVHIEDLVTCTRCDHCKWPLCSLQCPGLFSQYGHSHTECDLLSSSNHDTFQASASMWSSIYNTIVPLRCLLLKESDPLKWKILSSMESHNKIRKNIHQIWSTNQKTVVDQIRNAWGITKFSEEEIHTVCGILEVNCFEVGHNGSSLRALFPTAYLICHDCTPNTVHIDQDYHMTVRSSLPLHKGDPITLSYALTLEATMKRREHIKESKFFDCVCTRCNDPTELGTYLSAIKCQQCKDGLLLSSAPLQMDASWHCISAQCPGYSLTAQNVKTLMNRMQKEADAAAEDIEALEDFLNRYQSILHPNHYFMLGAKYSLSQLYGKTAGYLIQELTAVQLNRKKQICEELLSVLDVIEPGLSRIRGITMYELHAPIMVQLTRQFQLQNISKKDLKLELKRVVQYLREANKILSFEPLTSAEGEMCLAAKEALLRLQDWEQIIGKL